MTQENKKLKTIDDYLNDLSGKCICTESELEEIKKVMIKIVDSAPEKDIYKYLKNTKWAGIALGVDVLSSINKEWKKDMKGES